MNPNLFNNALRKVKSNPATEQPITTSKGFIMKERVGGREYRQQAKAPYNKQSSILEGRFIPKKGIIKGPWKHDLCPIQDKPKYRVFVRGLPIGTSSDNLKKSFARYGEIVGVQVDKTTADIYFSSRVAAQKAGIEGNQLNIQGAKIKVMCCDGVENISQSEVNKETGSLESDKLKGPKSILERIKKVHN